MAQLLAEHKVPLLIHQPSYSMFNRWIEGDHLLDTLDDVGAGCIAFSPLAQGLLTDRYLHGIPSDSRAATGAALSAESITEERLAHVRALERHRRSPWPVPGRAGAGVGVRDPRMTSLVIGASSVKQLDDNVAAVQNMSLTDDELAEIDRYAVDAGINLWKRSSDQ